MSGTGNAPPSPPATFSIATPQTPVNVARHGSVNIIIGVSPVGGAFNNAVALSATGLPPGATVTFNPSSVTPGSNGTSSTMTIQMSTQSALRTSPLSPLDRSPVSALALLLAACAAFLAFSRARVRRIAFATATLGCALIFLGGCNGYSTPQGASYSVTVMGTSGSLHPSATITVVVQ